jgi:predicted nucleic acid-binding protein
MTELLARPYRTNNKELVDAFYTLLTKYPGLTWVSATVEVADIAARIRALHGLKTPDALQAATAEYSGATGMITNDAVFERVTTFETLLLNGLL